MFSLSQEARFEQDWKKQPGKESPKMVGDAKPMLETFLDFYNHVMVDLRDPRFMNVNDISDALS